MDASLQEQIIVEEVSRLVELTKELQDSASSFISRSTGEEQSLRQRVISIDSDLQKLYSSLASSVGTGTLDQKVAEQVLQFFVVVCLQLCHLDFPQVVELVILFIRALLCSMHNV